jgi:cyclohexyl-isocyanide hydratase
MALEIGMLLFPKLTQLDLTGPYEVMCRLPDARVRLFARTLEPVPTEGGLTIIPNATFDDVKQLDILFVPGGGGQIALANDLDTLAYLRSLGTTARW